MAHAEMDVLQSIIDGNSAAKRITVTQKKELSGLYRRLMSVIRNVSYDCAVTKGENRSLREQIAVVNSRAAELEKVMRTGAVRSGENVPRVDRVDDRPKVVETTNTLTYSEAAKGKTDKGKPQRDNKTQKMKALEAAKRRSPPNEYSVLFKDAQDRKSGLTKLWREITKVNKTAKTGSIRDLPGGGLAIRPADKDTMEALEGVRNEVMEVRKTPRILPKVIIYDVDRELDKSDIAVTLAHQNLELEMTPVEAKAHVRPLFRKEPRDGNTVW